MSQQEETFSVTKLTNISSIGFQIQTLLKLLGKCTLTRDDVQNWVNTHREKNKLNNKDAAIASLFSCGAFKLALKLKDVISSDQINLLYQILNFDTENYEKTMDSIHNNACFDLLPKLQDILKIESHLLYYSTFSNKSLLNILLRKNMIKDDNWVTFINYIDRQHQNLSFLGRSYLRYISYSIVLDFLPSLSCKEVTAYRDHVFNDSAFTSVFIKLKLNHVFFQIYKCTEKFTSYQFQEETMESLIDAVYETVYSTHSNSISFLKKEFSQNERAVIYSQCFCAYIGAILTENNFYDNPIMKNWIHGLFIEKLKEYSSLRSTCDFESEPIYQENDAGNDFSINAKKGAQTELEDQIGEDYAKYSDSELRKKAQGLAIEDDQVREYSKNDKYQKKIIETLFQDLPYKNNNDLDIYEEVSIKDEDFEEFMRELKVNDKVEFSVSMKNFPDTFTARIFWKNRFLVEYESDSIINASKKCIVKLFDELDEKSLNYFKFPKSPVASNKIRIETESIRPSKKRKVKERLLSEKTIEEDDSEKEKIIDSESSEGTLSRLAAFKSESNVSTQVAQTEQENLDTLYTNSNNYQETEAVNEDILGSQEKLLGLLKTDDIKPDSKNILYGLSSRMKVIPEYRYFLQTNGLFTTKIYINNVKIAEAVHKNKKLSSQKAATLALKDKDMLKELGFVG